MSFHQCNRERARAASDAALSKLCKWRSLLTGWHLGPLPAKAPGVQAMRSMQDFRLIIQAEVAAVMNLLVLKGLVTEAEMNHAIAAAAGELDEIMAAQFRGYRTTPEGLEVFDLEMAQGTSQTLGFPP